MQSLSLCKLLLARPPFIRTYRASFECLNVSHILLREIDNDQKERPKGKHPVKE